MDLMPFFAAAVYAVLDGLGFAGLLTILIILVIIGLVIVVMVKFFLILIPAILVAVVVYFLTSGDLFWTGIAFLVVALLSLLRKI
ncbi:MAG: hypothetical protein LBH74_04940 [Nitrososphaerota archaeon]|jgi:hypothetical protein|nr:hypothetical protein [Nitrososphaerota archaeon]